MEYLCLGGWRVAVRWRVSSGGAAVLALRIWLLTTSTAKSRHTIQRLAIRKVFVMVVVAWIGTVAVERPVGGVWELMDGRAGKCYKSTPKRHSLFGLLYEVKTFGCRPASVLENCRWQWWCRLCLVVLTSLWNELYELRVSVEGATSVHGQEHM